MGTAAATHARVGPLLRDWRRRRRLSQMDLALEAGVSTRHLSFVETGRSRPSAELLLHLAEQLDVPLREANQLLLAAGYAPVYQERDMEDDSMAPVRQAIDQVLKGHEPHPACAVDREWGLIAGNAGIPLLLEGVDPAQLEPPVNVLRLALHPEGMAPLIANLGEWRGHLLARLRRQISATGDPALRTLLEELETYPAPLHEAPAPAGTDLAAELVVPLVLKANERRPELRFISIITTFGTAVDITVAELAIESFFPADPVTAEFIAAAQAAPTGG